LDSAISDGATPERCLGVDCSGLDEGCMMGVCDPADGSCTLAARPEASPCDDGDVCTAGDTCSAGDCAGEPLDCSATGGPCNVGACDSTTGLCVATPTAEGGTCDDGDACTMGESCTAGACGGSSAVDCSAMADACNSATCDVALGCVATPVADGSACDDGDGCTSGDGCTAGACAGSPRDCSGLADACNAGVCDAATGACQATPVTAGTACDDANACTSGDACNAGSCAGTPITTGACAGATVTFPSAGDTRVASAGLYFWRSGDYVEGSRSTSLPSTSSAEISLVILPNSLTCDSQDVELRVNGTSVGSFSISSTDTTITRSFSFPSIAGPNYTLRYQTVRAVGGGCGSAGYADDVSTVTLHL